MKHLTLVFFVVHRKQASPQILDLQPEFGSDFGIFPKLTFCFFWIHLNVFEKRPKNLIYLNCSS